jgi:hypothetical protein
MGVDRWGDEIEPEQDSKEDGEDSSLGLCGCLVYGFVGVVVIVILAAVWFCTGPS